MTITSYHLDESLYPDSSLSFFGDSLATFDKVAREPLGQLPAGETVIVLFDPTAEFSIPDETHKEYSFKATTLDGRPLLLKGGKRLFNALSDIPFRPGNVKLHIQALGEPRTFTRDFHVEVIK